MVKIYALEFQSNVAHGLNGGKRVDFSKGDIVLVSRQEESIYLQRLGCTLVQEADVGYDDITWPKPVVEEEKQPDAPVGNAAKTVAVLKKELADRSEELKAANLVLTGKEKHADLVALVDKLDAAKQ